MSNIVFVWAGWTWMSWLIWLLHDLWFTNLICIDANQSQLTDMIANMWINVLIGHWQYDVSFDDVVIYSAACEDSVEVKKAKSFSYDSKKSRMIWSYFEFLWEISKYFKSVWFSGRNGKSSMSSLAIYTAKKFLPDFWLGILWALVPDLDNKSYAINDSIKSDLQDIFHAILSNKEISDYKLLKKYYFLLEACEYKRHFYLLDLDRSLISNIALDHTDYFVDEHDYYTAYEEMVSRVWVGLFTLEAEWSTRSLSEVVRDHRKEFVLVSTEKFDFEYLIGAHHDLNWSLVYALILKLLSVDWIDDGLKSSIKNYMRKFKWLWRRMDLLSKSTKGVLIYSDYGHIAESIKLWFFWLKTKYPDKKISVIFQPHQMKRIIVGWHDFEQALKLYDDVLIYDIYAARENVSSIVSRLDSLWQNSWLKDELKDIKSVFDLGVKFAQKCNWVYSEEFSDVEKFINNLTDQVLVVYTAGDLDYKLRLSDLL